MWCIFGGTPLPEIKWTKKGGALPLSRTNYENHGRTLVIKDVDYEDGGDYTCEASNGVGIAKSYSIHLKVYAAPYFTKTPESKTAEEGEDVMFECEAGGLPAPIIKWIHNGLPIEKARPNPRRTITANSIILKNLTKQDTGNYGCNATAEEGGGYVYKDFFVNVLALEPEIIVSPEKELRTVTGSQITLTCKTFGTPTPIVKWFHNRVDELTGDRFNITSDGSLVISDVKFIDDGDYLCNATNKLGSTSKSGSLRVKSRTEIIQGPQPYYVKAGNPATFRCNAITDPDLTLTINWLKDGKIIDFDRDPHFSETYDNSLTIANTTEHDSGRYTCQAMTELDEVQKSASLIFGDVPDPPLLARVECNRKYATVIWKPQKDNFAPILSYKIQYNTAFNPDKWNTATDYIPATSSMLRVSMSPWSNYTFRVIARNQIGDSLPSHHSKVCLTPEDVPFQNPGNVTGRGTAPNNLVIYWERMPQIEHNAPNLKYRVYFKKDEPNEQWTIEEIHNWRQNEILIQNMPTFQKYRIKVIALNKKGQANVAAQEVIGYSGEARPSEAPINFKLREVIGPRSAIVSWEPVSKDSINGHAKGYKIQTWTEVSGETKFSELVIDITASQSLISSLKPYTLNYARVLVFNGAYNGPPSNIISMTTPEGQPGPIDMLECYPMGSTSLVLLWKKPQEINGVLRGYRMYYNRVIGGGFGPQIEREPRISNNKTNIAKLGGLIPHSRYRVTIKATTMAREGPGVYTDCDTNPQNVPSMPDFKYTYIKTQNGMPTIRVTWQPDIYGNPGSHFFVQYRKQQDKQWQATEPQLHKRSIEVTRLDSGFVYEVRVVAVDGTFQTPSNFQNVNLKRGFFENILDYFKSI